MNSKFNQQLELLKATPGALTGINRGIERESLRVASNGQLAQTPHPESLGKALTHSTITTDFAESLLEFITPVSTATSVLFEQLQDIHHYTVKNLGQEQLWPMSMPCYCADEEQIELAQYGTSNIGKMKTTYREGLKNRYGSMMQIISGVHYNFSLPQQFWQLKQAPGMSEQDKASAGYMALVRNFYRFGWVIPYLFGASPALCSSFLQGKKSSLPFEALGKGTVYLPYATSLRLSDLGYTNSSQADLCVSYNALDSYLHSVEKAVNAHSLAFEKIGVKENGQYKQLNANMLQIENELYAPIRPKRVTFANEKPRHALAARGIEYIEVRSLDVNPFAAVGITPLQSYFLDVFLTWCALKPSAEFDPSRCNEYKGNFTKVVLEGRKPGITLEISREELTIPQWGEKLMLEWREVAAMLDRDNNTQSFSAALTELAPSFADPELTLSGQLLKELKSLEIDNGEFAIKLSNQYKQELASGSYQYWTEDDFTQFRVESMIKQQAIESADQVGFDEFLTQYFAKK
ncbi:glutamate--cysteine ligase [Motilimonas cestriensis]|uniref:Glutamate--cysteine ligase n=1 Tax=Motilimonas cestriensis TaxID=2742685 RepID=A0ABS8WFW3_9GAMM|nr:glutamate--cysteine ligase [Motilimonas cestriensis]MCE2596240.1 glutamate--cysteine ligase [Motilimonas cestriensis]